MSIIKPLATAIVNGKPVRFFRSPSEGLEFPWHAYMDVLAAMDLPDDVQEHFLRMMRGGPYRDATRVLATSEGPTVIAAHFAAQGFIGALHDLGKATPHFEEDYIRS